MKLNKKEKKTLEDMLFGDREGLEEELLQSLLSKGLVSILDTDGRGPLPYLTALGLEYSTVDDF